MASEWNECGHLVYSSFWIVACFALAMTTKTLSALAMTSEWAERMTVNHRVAPPSTVNLHVWRLPVPIGY
jgi:hypothetical protein